MGKMIVASIWMLLFFLSVSCRSSVGQEHPASVLSSSSILMSALESGDVLFRIEQYMDSTEHDKDGLFVGQIERSRTTIRLVFDRSFSRAATFRIMEHELLDLQKDPNHGEGGGKTSKLFEWSINLVDREKKEISFSVNDDDRGLRRLSLEGTEAEIAKKLRISNAHDVRAVWFQGDTDGAGYELMKSAIDTAMVTPKKIWKLNSSKDLLSLRKDSQLLVGEKQFEFFKKYEFDPDSMRLSSYKYAIFPSADSKAVENESWKMEWQELGLVSVPLTLRRKELVSVGASRSGELETSTRFHWRIVNQDIQEELFEIANLNSLEKVMELTDLKKNGAENLESRVNRKFK